MTPETRKAIERYITYHLDDPAMQEPTKGWLRECLDEIAKLRDELDRYHRMEREGVMEQDLHETIPPEPGR